MYLLSRRNYLMIGMVIVSTVVGMTMAGVVSSSQAVVKSSSASTAPLLQQAKKLYQQKKFFLAARLYTQTAGRGYREGQYQLGLLYARGIGVKKDFATARIWLQKAAMQGHPKAQFHLGQMYLFGDGGQKDVIAATKWFWIATTLGDRYAKDSLRVMTGKLKPAQLEKANLQAKELWPQLPHDMKVKKKAMAMH